MDYRSTDSRYQSRYKIRSQEKFNVILRGIEPVKGKKILDIGCNRGFFTEKLVQKEAKVIAIDSDSIARTMIKHIESDSQNPRFMRVRIEDYDFSGKKFDIILYLSVHHHLINDIGIERANDVLKKIANSAKVLIFETGNRKEQGVHLIWRNKLPPSFNSDEGIILYVMGLGKFKKASILGSLPIHNYRRSIFLFEK